MATPEAQWAYALSFALRPELTDADGVVIASVRFVFDMAVTGRVGVGWTTPDDTAFVSERFVSNAASQIALVLRTGDRIGRLVFRNAEASGVPSTFLIQGARVDAVGEQEYPVTLPARVFVQEPVPARGGTSIVFDTAAAVAINEARMAWLEHADLPIANGRVLDVGCGVGHFIPFYTRRGCTVVAVDGREGNILELRRRHPTVDARVADVQTMDPQAYGQFDVVHCFGLLYHLESPIAALRRIHALCRQLLIMETMVCDALLPVSVLVDETKAASQAMDGLGTRSSPAFIALALNRVGFDHVYMAAMPPRHPDFQFRWTNNLETTRDGVPLRCMFVASRTPLMSAALVPLLTT